MMRGMKRFLTAIIVVLGTFGALVLLVGFLVLVGLVIGSSPDAPTGLADEAPAVVRVTGKRYQVLRAVSVGKYEECEAP
jgi:hypothetical protein